MNSPPTIEAEVVCVRYPQDLTHRRWVSYDLRHAGNERPPKGVEPVSLARCPQCLSRSDFTTFSGRVRVLGELSQGSLFSWQNQ